MEPLALAGAAVSLLVTFLRAAAGSFGNKAGEDAEAAAAASLGRLHGLVRERTATRALAAQTLSQLEQAPDDRGAQEHLRYALADLAAEDGQFAAALERLVAEAERDAGAAGVRIADAGAVSIGGNVTIEGTYAAGRDLTVGADAPRPPRRRSP